MELFYEDLYSERHEDNVKTIAAICTFLGIQPPSEKTIKKYMTPSKNKVNYEKIYESIPNYKQLRKRFSD